MNRNTENELLMRAHDIISKEGQSTALLFIAGIYAEQGRTLKLSPRSINNQMTVKPIFSGADRENPPRRDRRAANPHA